ncbi:hypothetical protein CAL29_28050 [Bordetella genomosp. 10]|uniref:Uncharacterized protein n=1 Tax=Bordetella genomosp. 10 TaxID=1416804 RepID=A0A261S307_9BORD|nr:hypothetical protein [Bordetella genomosp. 10]OZI31729.1 hypothetical protein CAL29_28050 [Bordetella genomosp. 10]
MSITALPTPPSRSDPANFPDRADAFMAALPQFATEANVLQQQVNEAASAVDADATAAASSATYADQRATAAAASAGSAAQSATAASSWESLALQSRNLAKDWASKESGTVGGTAFLSAYQYALLAAAGAGLPLYALNAIPTTNQGPIFVPTQGPMEWDGSRYVVLLREHGQCQFRFVSAQWCCLYPYNGNGLIINGRQYRIPAAGVALAIGALGGAGSYFVFAKDDGAGEIALEAVPTGSISHATHTDGVEIKAGDPSRTLVGMAYRNASAQFQFDSNIRGVASWHNRYYPAAAGSAFGAATINTSPTQVISPTYVWVWGGESVFLELNGTVSNNQQGYGCSIYLYEDSTAKFSGVYHSGVNGQAVGVSLCVSDQPSEGMHAVATYVAVNSGTTGTFTITQAIIARP